MQRRFKLKIILILLSIVFLVSFFTYKTYAKTFQNIMTLGYDANQAHKMINYSNFLSVYSKTEVYLSKQIEAEKQSFKELVGSEFEFDSLNLTSQLALLKYNNYILFHKYDFVNQFINDNSHLKLNILNTVNLDDNKIKISPEFKKIFSTNELHEQSINEENTTIDRPAESSTSHSGILIVNKKNALSSDYNPGENGEAGRALRSLIVDMQVEGLDVSSNYSGFRSYQSQADIYNYYVSIYGQSETDKFSARPGHSEHQTGLAFDLLNGSGNLIGDGSSDLAQIAWLEANAYKYGFIIRYPKGKQAITGYQYEPWHLRYVGSLANDIHFSGLTLEEYFNVSGGDYY